MTVPLRYAWHIRPATPSDRRYVVMTWRSSLQSTKEYGGMSRGEFRRSVDRPIDRLLDRADTRVLVAAPHTGDGQSIAGWIVCTPLGDRVALHYLYVRYAARGSGCALRLAAHAGLLTRPVVYTFRGPDHASLLTQIPDALYVPPTTFS